MEKKNAGLLIGEYDAVDDLRKKVLDSPAVTMDRTSPTCRYRGTVVDLREGEARPRITGWQRNVGRIGGMDVSLPAVITVALNEKHRIESVELDDSFRGSKGLMCSRNHLNRRLQRELTGHVFDGTIINKAKVRNTHCFHVFEVLSGMYSCDTLMKKNGYEVCRPESFAFEEEVIDSVIDGDTLCSEGVYLLKNKPPVRYRLVLHDIMKNVGFSAGGILKTSGGIGADFSLNGTLIESGTVSVNNQETGHVDIGRFLFMCISHMKRFFCIGPRHRLFNTNLYPGAYIGMLVQSIAIRLFNDNYRYIMHVLTALQRNDEVPLCIGSVLDQKEASVYFPGFDTGDLI